jgi:DNA repair photolyase
MIVSASYRTDIPAFHTRWLLERLAAGYAEVRNPYGGAPYRVSLAAGDVTGFVLWTRNLKPLLPHLPAIAARAPFTVQFTLTGYPRALEPAVIAEEAGIAQLQALRRDWGPRVAVWRYDPILATSLTPPEAHRASFTRIALALRGSVDEVVVSFADLYRKSARNLAAAAKRHGFTWRDPEPAEKRVLLADLARIAAEQGMHLTLCTEPELVCEDIAPARCIDAERLSDVAQQPIAAREKGNRPGCLCAESRDIGAYDTCAQGCVYCYAVSSSEQAAARIQAQDASAPSLGADARVAVS